MEHSSIFGLGSPARCIIPHGSETERTRFLVGTVGLKDENEIRVIDFDEDDFEITTQSLKHPDEVFYLSASSKRTDLLLTCHSNYALGSFKKKASLWMFGALNTDDRGKLQNQAGELWELLSIECQDELDMINEFVLPIYSDATLTLSRAVWDPFGNIDRIIGISSDCVGVFSLDSGMSKAKLSRTINLSAHAKECGNYRLLNNLKCNPHYVDQLTVATGPSLIGLDLRSSKTVFSIPKAHESYLIDLDYNPNKPYHMMTGGDDGFIRFWDSRNLSYSLKEIEAHSHWVWSVKYNNFHDQLILSGGSDCAVNLHNAVSVSSRPIGASKDTESDEYYLDSSDDEESFKKKLDEGLVSSINDFEDSIYSVSWSNADPWTFASLSYDGRVTVSMIPKTIYYSIIL